MGPVRLLGLGYVLLLLAACGGGGGRGGGEGPGNTGNFTIATSNVTIEGDPNGPAPAPAVVTGSITGVNQTVFLTVTVTTNGIANATVTLTSATTGQLAIFPKPPAQLGFGTFTDTVTVRACLDSGCSQQISGSPKTVNVTYNVRGLTVNPPIATLTSTEGKASAAMQVTLTNGSGANWTSSITYQQPTTGWLSMTPTSGSTQGAQTLTFSGNALGVPGTYQATVQLSGGTRTQTIPVTYTVSPNLGLTDSAVHLSAVTGQTAPPVGRDIGVFAASGATTFTTSVSYGAGASNWLATTGTTAPGTVAIVPQSVALVPGAYTATVTLTPNGLGTPVSFGVTYTLAASELTLSPFTASFDIRASTPPESQFLQRGIATGDTGAPLTWTASDDQPWVSVTPAGSSGQDAVLTLDPSAVESLRNGTHSAVITFTYNGPSVVNQTRQQTVDLLLDLPTIEYAMPYVAYLNEEKELVLRGSGFSQSGGDAVTFDGTPADQKRLVSDTEIRVTPPASVVASASRPVIAIANALGLQRSDSELVVRAKPDYGTQQFPFSIGMPSGPRVLYDAERDVLFVLRTGTIDPPASTSDSVMRFALDPAGVNPPAFTSRQFDFSSDIGLSPDGTTLYAVTNTQLHFLDPEDLSTLKAPLTVPSLNGLAGRMAVVNTGEIVFPHMRTIFSPQTGEFRTAGVLDDSPTAVSADGSQVALQPPSGTGNVFLGVYDPNVDAFRFLQQQRSSSPLSLDRHGMRIAHGGEVFETVSLSLHGSAGGNGYFSVLSPDGNRLYAVTYDPLPRRVHVWDTSNFTTTTFPELAPIEVPFGVNAMGISLNGEHLFIIDADNLFIVEP